MNERPTILLADDTESDIHLLRVAFKKAKCNHLLQEVPGGAEAIAYLKGESPYGDRHKFPLPKLMLLDLSMPMTNGFDVLGWVRSQPVLKRLGIFILTASMRNEDMNRAFDLGANSFLVKPSDLEALTSMVQCLSVWVQLSHFVAIDQAEAG